MSKGEASTMRKELRHLLNKHGAVKVQETLDELISAPTPRYRELWPEGGAHRAHCKARCDC